MEESIPLLLLLPFEVVVVFGVGVVDVVGLIVVVVAVGVVLFVCILVCQIFYLDLKVIWFNCFKMCNINTSLDRSCS